MNATLATRLMPQGSSPPKLLAVLARPVLAIVVALVVLLLAGRALVTEHSVAPSQMVPSEGAFRVGFTPEIAARVLCRCTGELL